LTDPVERKLLAIIFSAFAALLLVRDRRGLYAVTRRSLAARFRLLGRRRGSVTALLLLASLAPIWRTQCRWRWWREFGHWATGAIDWRLMGVLLVGFYPAF
jgi:hypothetical protein